MTELFESFAEVFPGITLSLEKGGIQCKQNGQTYDVGQLSDGEKQVFLLLADALFVSSDGAMFLVDEPELQLHPRLADTLWTSVERRRPTSKFVYATHSLSFAMRPSVDTRIVLSGPNRPPLVIGSPADLPAEHQPGIPGCDPGHPQGGQGVGDRGTRGEIAR
jgi:ABC-type Mn2+/Zn2+ transport system ATPase subunit